MTPQPPKDSMQLCDGWADRDTEPLIVPCVDHYIYINRYGLHLLIRALTEMMTTDEKQVIIVRENRQDIQLKLIPSTQTDFETMEHP